MKLEKENKGGYEIKIKNMVCDRCITTVQQALTNLGAQHLVVELGAAKYENELEIPVIKEALQKHGFELIEKSDDILVEEIKLFMQSLLADLPLKMKSKLSEMLSKHFAANYEGLSKRFSQHERITLERYFLLLKIEKAKELIQYGHMNFTEIAHELDYASINHLSRQFKTHLGMSLTAYKQQSSQRKPIDKIM